MEAPLALFVWSKSRIVPVRVTDFSITEEAFDPALNPIRAKVSLGLRVLSVDDLGFAHKGGSLFMAYLQRKERLAAKAPAGGARDARHRRHPVTDPVQTLDALLQSAVGRRRSSFRRPAATTASRPRRSRPRRRHASSSYLRRRFVPPPERFALLQAARGRAGDRLDNLAAKYLGDPEQFWRLCDANGAMRPGRADRDASAARCASPCRKAFRGAPSMLADRASSSRC